MKILNVLEGFSEVLARLFLGAPSALPALLGPEQQQQQQQPNGSSVDGSSSNTSLQR